MEKAHAAIKDVIQAMKQENPHIPIRNSKLAALLQPYLTSDTFFLIMLYLDLHSGTETDLAR